MSKRGFAERLAIKGSVEDDYTSPVDLANHELMEAQKLIENGNPHWQQAVIDTARQLQGSSVLDYVANPETKGWSPDGRSEGIGKRLDAAMNSWRMDASGGHPVEDDEEGGVVWRAGWDTDAARDPAYGHNWRKYIVLCSASSEDDSIVVDPSSVAVFVAGRQAGLEGRDEWTLFVGGEELADAAANRIGGGLIVDTVNEAKVAGNKVVSGIGRAGLIASIDTSWNNYSHHSIENPTTGTVADVTYSRDFGSSHLVRPENDVYYDIAYPIFQDTVDSFSATEDQ